MSQKTSPAGPCPPDFQSVLSADLGPAEEAQLAAHLDACARCRDELSRQANWRPTEYLGRRRAAPLPIDEALVQAMRGLKAELSAGLARCGDPASLPALAGEPWACGEFGPYEVRRVLGRGGTGVVLEAFDRTLSRPVAIKALAPHLASGATARRRFAREARAAAAVRHEHIIHVHAVAEAEGLPYLVMELVPGGSLQDLLDARGPLAIDDVLDVGAQVARGLEAAHARGLVHRDVKPANILLDRRPPGGWHVKLTDFGLARAVDDAALTQSGVVAGTPLYMAPEQARGEPLDHRADLFSLGSVLYCLCAGEPPFRAASMPAVLKRICDEAPMSLCEINPAVPPWLAAVVTGLLAKDPGGRLGPAGEVARLLESYRDHRRQPRAIVAPELPPHLRPPGSRAGWGAALVLLLTGLATLGMAAWPSARPTPGLRPICPEATTLPAKQVYKVVFQVEPPLNNEAQDAAEEVRVAVEDLKQSLQRSLSAVWVLRRRVFFVTREVPPPTAPRPPTTFDWQPS